MHVKKNHPDYFSFSPGSIYRANPFNTGQASDEFMLTRTAVVAICGSMNEIEAFLLKQCDGKRYRICCSVGSTPYGAGSLT